ncbi:hypothetical protein, partial [Bifidobacterium longum]|uniref:hypothetical protein n=1 Tax=Bifidobacterium longum TaxID=216816 RepID=UPI001E600315
NNDVVSIPPNYPTSTTTPRPTHPHQTAKGQFISTFLLSKSLKFQPFLSIHTILYRQINFTKVSNILIPTFSDEGGQ